jgi:hypothetical protein
MSLSRAFFLGCVVFLGGCGSEVTEPNGYEPTTWVRRSGRTSDSESVGLAGLPDGGVVMVGRYYGEVDFGGGNLPSPNDNFQAYVVKYDGAGNHVFSKSYGAEFAESAVDVAVYPDGSMLVTGTFNWAVDFGTGPISPLGTDIFLLKLDASGKTVWAQSYGGEGTQRPTAIAVTNDGGAVLVGSSTGKLDVGLGDVMDTQLAAFVLRLDSKGEPKWVQLAESDSSAYIADVAVHRDSGVIAVGGYFDDNLSLGSLPNLVGKGTQDGFIAAFDDAGTALWHRAVGGNDYWDMVTAVTMHPKDPVIYATGQVQGLVDLGGGVLGSPEMYDPNTFLLAVATTGGYSNSQLYGRESSDVGFDIALDAESNVYVAGEYYDRIAFGPIELTSKGNSDAFIGKTRPNLEPAYQQGWGDSERQTAYRVAIDGTGRVYVAGSVYGTVDFGLGPTFGSGYYQTFLVALPR